MTNKQVKLTIWGIIAFVVVLVILAMSPFTVVDAGERAVIVRLGAVDRVLAEGFHILNPFFEDSVKFEIRTQKTETEAAAASKDLQDVAATITVNWNLIPDTVGDVYREYETLERLYTKTIIPYIQDEVKSATAKFDAEELITKRPEVKAAIYEQLAARLLEENVQVTQVSITDFRFSKAFSDAIEAKVTAAELALKAENDLDRVKFEQQQEIEKYRAQAEQTRLQNEALRQSTAFLELKRLEVLAKIAEKWNGALPQQFVPGSALPLLDITSVQ